MLAETANKYAAAVTISKDTQVSNAKSIFELMMLARSRKRQQLDKSELVYAVETLARFRPTDSRVEKFFADILTRHADRLFDDERRVLTPLLDPDGS